MVRTIFVSAHAVDLTAPRNGILFCRDGFLEYVGAHQYNDILSLTTFAVLSAILSVLTYEVGGAEISMWATCFAWYASAARILQGAHP